MNPSNRQRLFAFVLTLSIPFFLAMGSTEDDSPATFEARMLYSDGSALYRSPRDPGPEDSVVVKLRVKAGSVDTAALHYKEHRVDMAKGGSGGPFDWYFAEIPPSDDITEYWFEVGQDKKLVYYSRRGIELSPPTSSYRFRIIPGFEVPDWMQGAVLYQIFVDRFANGDKTNDVLDNEYLYDNWPSRRVNDWSQLPDAGRPYAEGSDRTREFYGGDLQGVIDKLDYLAELGVEGLYFSPLFVSPSNHKYDTQDYAHVDPHLGVIVNDGGRLIDPARDPSYGSDDFSKASLVNREASMYIRRSTDPQNLEASDELLKTLIREAHNRDIKVILDGVFNHAGSFNPWLDREGIYGGVSGAYWNAESPYRDYFVFTDRNAWPSNESYEAWYGIPTLPKLNLDGSPELEQKILDIAAQWIRFGADGWRLDVAADIGHDARYNHEFFRKFRNAVKAENPDAVVLAEVYGDSSAWLRGDEWDTVMNYDAFFEPVSWFLTGLEKHSYLYRADLHNDGAAFEASVRERMAKLPWTSLVTAMNQLDNHDHSRFLTRTSSYVDRDKPNIDSSDQSLADKNINKGIFKEAVVLQMILPGAPTLYYGNEAGVVGFTDPDSRRSFPWGNEDEELLTFFKDIIALHRSYPALKDGSYISIKADGRGLFACARWDVEDSLIAVVNNTEKERKTTLDLSLLGMDSKDELEVLLTSDGSGHSGGGRIGVAAGGGAVVTVPAWGSLVLRGDGADEPEPNADKLRPRISSYAPKRRASGDADIVITFSAPMHQRDILEAFSVKPALAGIFFWNGPVLTFRPEKSFESGSEVTVTVKESIRSLAGDFRLNEGIEWSYRVK